MFASVLTAFAILALFPLVGGYLVLLERKVLAHLQTRLGPMRVGPHGLLQPIADAIKLLLKEDIRPSAADAALFVIAPIASFVTAVLGFTLLPFGPNILVSDINVGILLISAVSALGILGIILGGWASNSHYPLLGALRSAAQLVSYEIALGLGLLGGVMAAGTLDLRTIVDRQLQLHRWNIVANWGAMIVPFLVFLIAGFAETNRLPFDLPEAESELVAGYHSEFSGFRWALYMLAEWGNVLVVSSVAVTLFLGGWLRPFPSVTSLAFLFDAILPALTFLALAAYCAVRLRLWILAPPLLILAALFFIPALQPNLAGLFWFFSKLGVFIYLFIWVRGTLPRIRYDQLMEFGWKFLIPLGVIGLMLNAVVGLL